MKTSKELRNQAWEQLRKSYWMVLVVTLIVVALPAGTSIGIIGFIIAGPLLVGQSIYLIDMIETNPEGKKIELLLEGFKKSFVNSLLAWILTSIFTFLWSLLFIIPGIIKGLAYSMTPYILAENPDMDAMKAIDQSQEMMKGHKMDLFMLYLSFIGWYILAMLTFGIGMIFLMPYINTTVANFYLELRGKKVVTAEIE